MFYLQSKHILVDVFRGLFTGKISFFYFPIVLIKTLLATFLLLGAFVGVLVFIPLILLDIDSAIFEEATNKLNWMYLFLALFIIITILLALWKIKIKNEEFDFSWNDSDPNFLSALKSTSQSNSSSSDSSNSRNSSNYSSSSDSSSNSFSGGGGRSGGGGASGSW